MYDAFKLKPVVSNDLVRLGREEDGGYIVNQRIIDKTKVLISFGISADWSFEDDFNQRKKGQDFRIEAYDFSVSVKSFLKISLDEFLKIFQFNNSLLHFKYSLFFIKLSVMFATFFNKRNITFHKKGIDDHVSGLFVDFKSVRENIGKEYGADEIFIKMDIEGYEFKVIESMLVFAEKINSIVVEFHDLDVNGQKFERILNLVNEKGFIISHVHSNNYGGFIENTSLPRLIEITFSKSTFFTPEELSEDNHLSYPRKGLDFPCIKSLPELEMTFGMK